MMFWKPKRIYADAAAATPLSRASRRELLRLLDVYGNAGALHHEGVEAKKELERARASVAASVGAHADEIIFTASGTEANNLAIQGILRPLLRERGELHAITSAIEHQSVLEPLRSLESDGLYTTELAVDAQGLVDPKVLKETVNEQTAFVSVQLVNSEIGTIEPVQEIAKQLRRARQGDALKSHGVKASPLIFHTDASQAPLWLDIKVEKLGVDLLTLDAQKVLGPKGVGALYVKRGTPIEPVLWGGSQEWGLRGGTPNVPLCGAFAVALEEAQKNVEECSLKISHVRNYLLSEIQKLIPDVILNGEAIPAGKEKSALRAARPSLTLFSSARRVANNLNISIPNLDGEMAVIAVDALGVAVSTRSACNTEDEEPSHVIKAILQSRSDLNSGSSMSDLQSKSAIRITLLPDVSFADARRIAKTLADVAKRYRIIV